jgi:hypothetical protein
MHSKSCVYWIRAPHHTDIFTEGYVGVSVKGATKRFREHKCAAKSGSDLPVHNAIRKYGNEIVIETVLNGDPEYCYLMEAKLRPHPRTGYNVSAGGESTNLGSKHTVEAKAKMSAKSKGRFCSEATRKLMSERSKGRRHTEETKEVMRQKAKARGMPAEVIAKAREVVKNILPWDRSSADKNIWLAAEEIFKCMTDNPEMGTRLMSPLVGFSYSQLRVIHKKIKAGWNPLEDTEWLIFSGKLSPDASGDKSLQNGNSPNQY